jgi:hypothetical protein
MRGRQERRERVSSVAKTHSRKSSKETPEMKTNEDLLAALGQAVEAELQPFLRTLVTTPDASLETLEQQVLQVVFGQALVGNAAGLADRDPAS